ncbi:unnamed protein product [Brassica napus]|uniref:(rape) hypothetical protein n=1 Tax=Brassica napus TaxID=3708 RepID=A0A816ZE37_BRANA|nr:unnamed protein product [Brassica napus]
MKEMYDLPYEVKIKNENHKASHGYIPCKDFSELLWPQGNDPFW